MKFNSPQSNVVNCFQKLLSSWRGTTPENIRTSTGMLWIAFKNYYLRDEEQLKKLTIEDSDSCELLSKIIIFVTRNNINESETMMVLVVNCFQKLLSSWRGTTYDSNIWTIRVLWIAFKNYYLRDEEQHKLWWKHSSSCCELLSKIIIFVTRNNTSIWIIVLECVVNCFQKLLSSWRGTTFYCWY